MNRFSQSHRVGGRPGQGLIRSCRTPSRARNSACKFRPKYRRWYAMVERHLFGPRTGIRRSDELRPWSWSGERGWFPAQYRIGPGFGRISNRRPEHRNPDAPTSAQWIPAGKGLPMRYRRSALSDPEHLESGVPP
jgi:hypothetical protein